MPNISESTCNKKVFPIKIGDGPENRYSLVLYEDREKYKTLVNILQHNRELRETQCVYSEELPYVGIKFYNKKWNEVGSKVLVLYSEPMGSGGFVSYEVLGKEDGEIKKILSQENVYQGTIRFKDGNLIQGMGNQFKVWKKENGEFVLKPYRIQPYPDANVVRYSIVDENTVEVDKTELSVPVGSVIQFIREDFNDVTDRLLFSNDSNCLNYLQYATFKITCKSKTTVTIIPSGYNWEGAKEVVIEAK
ncbi:MAG: hypothetical protein FH761_02765 [Firmicutes bacterium]|nr:hypothetical protein [Bacillota bacterium]